MLKVKGLIFAGLLTAFSAMPAAAQGLGAGLGLLGDEGGPGVVVEYEAPLGATGSGPGLNLVGDFSYFPAGGVENIDLKTLLIQVGARVRGEAGSNLSWLAHALVGMRRATASADDDLGALCDLADVDCSASDTGGVLTVGGGLEYALGSGNAIRGQIDFPIAIGDGGSTTRAVFMYIWKSRN